MCNDEQHYEQLALLSKIASHLEHMSGSHHHEPIDTTVLINSSVPYVVDYKGREHIYMYSATALTLTVEDVGTAAITANAWNDISFQQGMRLFAQGQSTLVSTFVRATNTRMPTASSSSIVAGDVNLTQVGGVAYNLGTDVMAGSMAVTIATDDVLITDANHLPTIDTSTASTATSTASTATSTATTATNTGTTATNTGTTATNTGRIPAQGQATMSASTPVALASDQSNVPANIKQVNGSTLALGQTTMSASIPVVLASDESNVPGNIKQVNGSTLALGQTTMSASVPTVIASDQSNLPANIKAVAGNNIAPGNNALPILNSAATGYVAAYGSNAAALTANTDYLFKWGAGGTTQVNHIMVINNSSVNLLWDLDVATNAGSPTLSNTAPGNTIFLDVQTSVLHIQANGTPNVNGSSASNIVVRGWL